MISELEALSNLQDVEQEMAQCREQLERLKPRAIKVQKRLKDGTAQLAREQSELKELRKNLDLSRMEIERLDGVIKHYEDQQGLIRTTKEMAALNHELAVSREKKKQLEAEVEMMEKRREEIASDLAELEGNAETLKERCEEEIADIKSEAEELKTQLKELKVKQAAIRAQVEEELLEEYDDLNKKYPGSALADAQGGSCLGCNMELIPQLKIDLKVSDKILRCHRCGRILRKDLDYTPPPEGDKSEEK